MRRPSPEESELLTIMDTTRSPIASHRRGWPPGLPVSNVRVARATHQLAELVQFYTVELGLPELDRFSGHAGYDGVMIGLPGPEHHLEFTAHAAGTPERVPITDDLLVLYLPDSARFAEIVQRLLTRHSPVAMANPYWSGIGAIAFEDPDGWQVVLVPGVAPLAQPDEQDIEIQIYQGSRNELRELFELAEDSPAALDSSLHAGRVLVAVHAGAVIGHLQLVDTDEPGQVELTNMAVRESMRGRGIGRRLVQAADDLATAESAAEMVVATAAADIDNLRFYQRQGFRLRSVERDAFTPASDYPPALHTDGIPLRDRVWLDRPVGTGTTGRRPQPD